MKLILKGYNNYELSVAPGMGCVDLYRFGKDVELIGTFLDLDQAIEALMNDYQVHQTQGEIPT